MALKQLALRPRRKFASGEPSPEQAARRICDVLDALEKGGRVAHVDCAACGERMKFVLAFGSRPRRCMACGAVL